MEICPSFFYDIFIYSQVCRDHLYHLEIVLQILKKERLFAKLSKCSFGAIKVDYLGHTISPLRVVMNSNKVSVVKEWPRPNSIKQLRGFLG